MKCAQHCNCRKFRTWFNFVYFVLLPKTSKSTELVAFEYHARISVYVTLSWLYESLQPLECGIFTRTKISAITVVWPWM